MRRAVVVLAVAAAVAAGAMAVVWNLRGDEWQFVGGSGAGWALRVPSDWGAHRLVVEEDGEPCVFAGYHDGVVVTNGSYPFAQNLKSCTGTFDMSRFPRTAVALTLQPRLGQMGLFRFDPEDNTTFPLHLSDLEPTGGIRGGPAEVLYGSVIVDETPVYDVRVWIGRDASREDREALERVLGTVRFEPRSF